MNSVPALRGLGGAKRKHSAPAFATPGLGDLGDTKADRKKNLLGVFQKAAGKVAVQQKTKSIMSSFVADLRSNFNVQDEDSSDSDAESEELGLEPEVIAEIKQERKAARAHTTAASLMRRESIKYNPEVHVVIGEMWAAIDADRVGMVDQETYANFIYLLGKVVTLFWDEEMEELEYEEAEDEAEHDFNGKEMMDYDAFFKGVYQICDNWTDHVSTTLYVNFLKAMRDKVTIPCLEPVDNGIGRCTLSRRLATRDDIMDMAIDSAMSAAARGGHELSLTLDEKIALLIFEYDRDSHRWNMTEAIAKMLRSEVTDPSSWPTDKDWSEITDEATSEMVLTLFREKGIDFKEAWIMTEADCKKSLNVFYQLEKDAMERKARGGHVASPPPKKRSTRRRSIVMEEYTNNYKSELFEPGKGREAIQAKLSDTGAVFAAKSAGASFGMKQMFDQKQRRAAGQVENLMDSVASVAVLKEKKREDDEKRKDEGPEVAPWLQKKPVVTVAPATKVAEVDDASFNTTRKMGLFLSKQAGVEGNDIGKRVVLVSPGNRVLTHILLGSSPRVRRLPLQAHVHEESRRQV
jgi:hypothetical protein